MAGDPTENRSAADNAGCRRGSYASRGLALSYLEWGAPDAPCLVLLHGGLEHAHAWDHLAPALARKWRVIAPDLRGHGDSDWSPGGDYAVLDYASDLAALLDTLGIVRAALVGHSLGGAVAAAFAALYPERIERLCLIEGLRPAGQRSPQGADAQIAAIRAWSDRMIAPPRRKRVYPDAAAAAARLIEHDPRLPAELARDLAAKGTRPMEGEAMEGEAMKGGVVWKYDERVRLVSLITALSPEPQAFWERIACPVLLVYGAESWATSPGEDGRLAHFRDARLHEIAGAGHNVHHNQPRVFLDLLEAFLEEAAR